MNNSIMWSCECGNDNFIMLEDTLEHSCINEIEGRCEMCGEEVTINVQISIDYMNNKRSEK